MNISRETSQWLWISCLSFVALFLLFKFVDCDSVRVGRMRTDFSNICFLKLCIFVWNHYGNACAANEPRNSESSHDSNIFHKKNFVIIQIIILTSEHLSSLWPVTKAITKHRTNTYIYLLLTVHGPWNTFFFINSFMFYDFKNIELVKNFQSYKFCFFEIVLFIWFRPLVFFFSVKRFTTFLLLMDSMRHSWFRNTMTEVANSLCLNLGRNVVKCGYFFKRGIFQYQICLEWLVFRSLSLSHVLN